MDLSFLFAPARAAQQTENGTKSPPPKKTKHSVKQTIAKGALELLVLYGLFSPFVARPIYDLVLFHPTHTNPAVELRQPIKQLHAELKVDAKEVFFPAPGGVRLNGWYFHFPGATKIIIVSHGNAGDVSHRAILIAALLCCRADVFIYDYEGYGQSTGKPSIKGMVRDGVAAFDYVTKNLGFKNKQVVLYGESIGTGVSTAVSEQRTPGALILQCGFSSMQAAGTRFMPLLPLYPGSWYDNLDNIEVMSKPHAPLLILHGDADQVLDMQHSIDLYKAAIEPKEFVLLKHFGHCIEQIDHMQYLNTVKTFLASLK